jgi:hypothetical protein
VGGAASFRGISDFFAPAMDGCFKTSFSQKSSKAENRLDGDF